jgi:hypothetical protein
MKSSTEIIEFANKRKKEIGDKSKLTFMENKYLELNEIKNRTCEGCELSMTCSIREIYNKANGFEALTKTWSCDLWEGINVK